MDEGFPYTLLKYPLILAYSRPQPAKRIGDADHCGVADLPPSPFRLIETTGSLRTRSLDPNLGKAFYKQLTIFRIPHSLDGSSKNLHAVAFQYRAIGELDRAIQRCLAAEPQEDAIRSFLFNHSLYKIRIHRE